MLFHSLEFIYLKRENSVPGIIITTKHGHFITFIDISMDHTAHPAEEKKV